MPRTPIDKATAPTTIVMALAETMSERQLRAAAARLEGLAATAGPAEAALYRKSAYALVGYAERRKKEESNA